MIKLRDLSGKSWLLLVVAAAAVTAAALVQPISQDPDYHRFADARTLFRIPNFWNVASNLPFVLVGVAGITFTASRGRPGLVAELHPAYVIFFAGVLLTGFGSAWYHLAPDNHTLIWDRLPMTLAFMALFAIVLGEHLSPVLARILLLPLLAAGAASVGYWALTELQGSGDLRAYALVQFLPMLMIPLVLLTYRTPYDRHAFLWWVIVIYAASKLLEYYDREVFSLGGLVSGHSLKHAVAALAPLVFLHGLATRRPAA